MVSGTIRIAGNDPGLAHAVAGRAITTLRDRSKRMHERLFGMNVGQTARTLRAHFGELLLSENIIRATGSRARAAWVALDAGLADDDLVPIRIGIQMVGARYLGLTCDELRLRITAHTVARVLQRTTHDADIKSAGSILAHHVAQAAALIEGDTLRRGDEVRTASPEGALLWEVQQRIDGKLILQGQTWLAADTAAEASIRDACSKWATVVRRRA